MNLELRLDDYWIIVEAMTLVVLTLATVKYRKKQIQLDARVRILETIIRKAQERQSGKSNSTGKGPIKGKGTTGA